MNNNQLRLYIDFKSPGAYLAVTPSLKLAEEFGLTVDWRPINTRQEELPPEPRTQMPHTKSPRIEVQPTGVCAHSLGVKPMNSTPTYATFP